MRFWITQKAVTTEAIIKAIKAGTCITEHDVEAMAKRFDDYVEWVNPAEESELEM